LMQVKQPGYTCVPLYKIKNTHMNICYLILMRPHKLSALNFAMQLYQY
jgi:hypothetical protein